MAKRRAKKPEPKKTKAPPKITAVRKDSRGHYTDVATGKPVPAERARHFKTFYDSQGRRRLTKGGAFAGGEAIEPTTRAKRRKGLANAYRPSDPRERAGRQETLRSKRRKGKKRPAVTKMRYTGKRRTRELEKRFGIQLTRKKGKGKGQGTIRSDFTNLVETQGRELGRGSFFVADPIATKDDKTILRGVEKATRAALRDVGPQVVALTVNVVVQGGEVGSQTLITRSDERSEVVGGVMSAVMSSIGEAGLDASDGDDPQLDPVEDLGVEVIAYELE